MNIFNFDQYHSNFLLELHGVFPILSKCCWFELWTCHNGQPIGHFGVSFVFTLVSLLAKLFGFYFMFLIFSCFLASVQPHLRILFSFFGFLSSSHCCEVSSFCFLLLFFFLFLQVVCISLALMIPCLVIQLEEEGKPLQILGKKKH